MSLNPADMAPWKLARETGAEVDSILKDAIGPTDFMARCNNCLKVLEDAQLQLVIMADERHNIVTPGSPLDTLYWLSYKAGLNSLGEVRCQLRYWIEGGKGMFVGAKKTWQRN